MNTKHTAVAVNGSPHTGAGNTALLIGMLRESLAAERIAVETIDLCDREIEYCTGCGHCMEKGNCWIVDDHAGIADRLLAADVWLGISRGEIDGRQAFLSGRYKVEGDLSLLMNLGALFRR